jgi:hypothetical protein
VELWDEVFVKHEGYAFNDIVFDLPFPASYQKTQALIASFYRSMNLAIQGDAENRQHGCTAEELLSITYDISTQWYSFSCGDKGYRVEATMTRYMAALFGLENGPSDRAPDDAYVTVAFAKRPMLTYGIHATRDNKIWARVGHKRVREPHLLDGETLPIAVMSRFPVVPSLGTSNMVVETNIIEPTAVNNGRRESLLAIVPANWGKEGTSVFHPINKQSMIVNTGKIRSINIKIKDERGHPIKFMGNTATPIIACLTLKRAHG